MPNEPGAGDSMNREERILILAPTGRDAAMTADFLARADLRAEVCGDIEELCGKIGRGAGLIFLTGETLNQESTACLIRELSRQPPWSDVPLIVLTSGGGENPVNFGALAALGERGNVTLVERPVRLTTLLSAVHSALRARRRQYEARDYLAAQIKAKEDLKQSEQRFRGLQQATPDGFMLFESVRDRAGAIIDFRWLFVNPAAERIVGRPYAELLGKRLLEEMPGNRADGLFGEYARVVETGAVWQGEIHYRHENLDHYLRTTAVKVGDGFAVGFSDISANKKAEIEREQLLAREQAARREVTNVLERITDGFVSLDREWRYTYINRAGAAMAGQTVESFLSKTVWEIYPDAVGTKYDIEYRRAVAEQTAVEFEEYLPSVGVWLEVKAYPSETGLSVFFRDVTQRKFIETERERLFQSEQAARIQAETANRLKDEFLATVSHELRTPLNAILGWAQMLTSGASNETYLTRGLETIYRNAKSQAQLIEDLLDVSRIITGKLHLDTKPVSLDASLRAAIETMRPAIDAKAIDLRMNLQDAPPVLGDSERLQQVFWNIISNAVKFTPERGRIEINLKQANPNAEISVSDSGRGIGAEFLPHVFERFRQADGSSTRKYGGLGLGLAIVRHIVELHGGTVEAASDGENKGTTFTVKLPLWNAVASSQENQIENSAGKNDLRAPRESNGNFSNCPAGLPGLRVLLVDDEADTLEMLEALLTRCGVVVKSCNSAENALRLVKEWRPDILVSDIAMPEADGYTLVERLRKMPAAEGGATPVIALTAYVRIEDRIRALSSGFQMYVPKPVEPQELLAALANLAARNNVGD